jgi:hypothetical protein
MTAELLLSRLERVKRTGPGKWIASCPTRDDRSPSLSIRELDDGRVLIHDFGGDDVEAILGAVGLTFADLYPSQPVGHAKPVRRPFNAFDVLSMVAFESHVAMLIASDMISGNPISDDDLARLRSAVKRLNDAVEACRGV